MSGKKKYIALLSIGFFLHSTSFARALTPTGTPTAKREARITNIQEKKNRMEEKGEARITTIQQRAASRSAMLDERKKQILTRILEHRSKLFDHADRAILRLDEIWKRVENRIEKIKAQGGNVSKIESQIAAVKDKRQAAVDAIAQAKSKYTDETAMDDIVTNTTVFRQSLLNVKTAIRSYHQSIVTVIRSLKDVRVTVSRAPKPSLTGSQPSPTGATP